MSHVIVRYTLKPDRVEENEGLVRAVFEQLARERPAGLRYATYRLPDGVSFVHVASVDTADGVNPLPSLSSFQEFTRGIKDRCVDPPVAATVEQIGAYPPGA